MAAVLLSSCSEGGMLMPNVDRVEEAEIVTADPGIAIQADDTLKVEIRMADNRSAADAVEMRLVVQLFDAEGEELAAMEFEDALHEGIPAIRLPDGLEHGYYELRYRLYQADSLITTHEHEFFVADMLPELGGISIYPSRLEPDSQGILQAVIQDVPEGMDPYIVWRFDSRVIAEGTLAEGLDEVLMRSPDSEGVYTVRVDVYPFAPRQGEGYGFTSSLFQRAEAVVSRNPAPRSYELQPADSYYSLLRLNGNLRDIGRRENTTGFEAESGDEPELTVEDGRLGHTIEAEDVLVHDAAAVPFGTAGSAPYTVSFRGRFGAPGDRENWLNTREDAQSLHIYSENGMLQAEIDGVGAGETIRFSVSRSIIPVDTPVQWSFSYLREGDTAFGMWFVNGILAAADTASVTPAPAVDRDTAPVQDPGAARDGETRLGGGITGVLQEFGVYYQDELEQPSINTGEFRRAMELQYPDTLVYAESFAGGELAGDFQASEGVTAAAGQLTIPPGEELQLPAVLFQGGDIIFELLFNDDEAADAGTGDSGQLVIENTTADGMLLEMPLRQEMRVQVGTEGGDLVVRDSDLRLPDAGDFDGVTVTVRNTSDVQVDLRLKHVLARHAESDPAAALFARDQ